MMNFIKKSFLFIIKAIFSVTVLLLLVSAIIIALQIKVNLSQLNEPIELAVESLLKRDFSMEGDVVLIPTLWPTLEIHDVSIGNPDTLNGQKYQWQTGKTMAHLGRLRFQLGLMPLLSGEIHVADITAEEVTFTLENNKDDISNWMFDLPEQTSVSTTTETAPSQNEQPLFHFEALDNIVFNKININYLDQVIDQDIHFNLEQLKGKAPDNQDIELEFNGLLQDKKYSVTLKGGGVDLFRDKTKPWPLTINMLIAGTKIGLSGVVERGTGELSAELEIGKTDIGAMLSWLKVMQGLEVGSEHLNVSAKLSGKNLAAVLRNAELSILLNNAWWDLRDKNTGSKLDLKITQGQINIRPNKPAQIELQALLEQEKIHILVTGAPIIDYTHANKKTPLVLDIKAYDSHLSLKTQLSKNMDINNIGFNMSFKGKQLDDFNTLLKMDLPPIGPYSLAGYVSLNSKGYHIKNLLMTVKESQLKGDMRLDTQAKPILLKVDLKSELVQINNFDVGDWTPSEDKESTNEPIKEAQKTDHTVIKNKQKARKLLSYETLSRFDVDTQLDIEKVLSGADVLGSAKASVTLKKARFNIQLSELKLPSGDASADFIYHPSQEKELDIALKLKVEKFDYGIMARRIDAKSDVGGIISLDIDLASQNADNIDSLLNNSQGYLDFSLVPKSLDAALFDMWAVNLISALLKDADKVEASVVNCVIARFGLNQGLMKQKVIYADTTNMIVNGTAEANFNERSLLVQVAPKAKKPEFFSLATPIGITGTFDDFNLDLSPLALTKTVASFVTSPVHVPIRRILTKDVPSDGAEACKAMWETPSEKSSTTENPK